MKQLELSAFLAFIAIMFGGHYFFRNTQVARNHRETTYVPEASLSDEQSWNAWQGTVSHAVSTEMLVKNEPSSNRRFSSGSSRSSVFSTKPQQFVSLEQMRQNSSPMASEQQGGSFASGIVLDRTDLLPSDALSYGSETSIPQVNLAASQQLDTPNLVPNLLSLGVFSEDGANRSSINLPQSTLTLAESQPASTLSPASDGKKTVVSVPVIFQAQASQSPTTLKKSQPPSDPFSPERVFWLSLIVTLFCGGVGFKKYLLPKYLAYKHYLTHRKQPSLNSPPSVQ